MSLVALGISVGSFVWVMGFIVAYFKKVPQAKLTADITGFTFQLVVGIGLAVTALVWSSQSGSLGVAVIVPAVLATMMASMILWLLTLRKTPVGDIKVKVGDKLLAFEALTSEGTEFHTDELAGKLCKSGHAAAVIGEVVDGPARIEIS